MPRIGATISGLEQLLLTQLSRADSAAVDHAIRLATGKQLNQPADDPSAFLQLSQFQRRLSVVQDAKVQVDAAASIGAQSQLVVDEVRTQLDGIRAALEQDAEGSLSDQERAVQQVAIDDAIESIDDLIKTEIGGRRFLDGSVNFRLSGKDSNQIENIQVFALRETQFSGTVATAATQAEVTYTGAAGNVTDDATISLTGKRGGADFTLTSGQSLTDVAGQINQSSHETGITAVAAGDDLILTSVDYGAAATIDVGVTSGTFSTVGTTQGTDVVVSINGQSIGSSLVDGNRARYVANGTHIQFDFQPGFTGAISSVTVSDVDVAHFQLSPDLTDTTRFGVPGLSSDLLGGRSGRVSQLAAGGALAGLAGNTSQAIRVVDEALSMLTQVEGTVDAFADVTVGSAASLLGGLSSQLSGTIDQLESADEEVEQLLLTKNQSLGQNTITAISVLQQQQASMLDLIRQIAGV